MHVGLTLLWGGVGTSPQTMQELAKPLQRLFFAGEATSKKHPGTVHGALLSGWDAAQALMALHFKNSHV